VEKKNNLERRRRERKKQRRKTGDDFREKTGEKIDKGDKGEAKERP
jgi:hypothetical protein